MHSGLYERQRTHRYSAFGGAMLEIQENIRRRKSQGCWRSRRSHKYLAASNTRRCLYRTHFVANIKHDAATTTLFKKPAEHVTIDDLISKSDYELFIKMCLPGHSLYQLLPPSRISKLRQRDEDILFCCQNILQISTQNIVYCTITLSVCPTLITLQDICTVLFVIGVTTLLLHPMFYAIMCLFLYWCAFVAS